MCISVILCLSDYLDTGRKPLSTERGENQMKENLHPNYDEAVITCACGNVIKTRSTKAKISVDVCSKCHPFFTGKQKLVDAGGRVDRFKKRFNIQD